jgi:hypothetical protein
MKIGEMENFDRSCLEILAFLDYAKMRARIIKDKDILKFLSRGRDRDLLDFLVLHCMTELKNHRLHHLLNESVRVLFGWFSAEYGYKNNGFWLLLEPDFKRSMTSGAVKLRSVDFD